MNCIGIISALSSEAYCLAGHTIPVNEPVQINAHAIAIVCGMGEVNARIGAQTLLEKQASALVSWGTAGALTEALQPGDLLLADAIVSDKNKYSLDTEWNQRITKGLNNNALKIHSGMIAHAEQVLTIAKDKETLQHKTDALAVDMESLAIAQIANEFSLPCISVRAIVDRSTQCIPRAIMENTNAFGRPDLFPLFFNLIRQPSLIIDLIKLGLAMKVAIQSLQTVAKSQILFAQTKSVNQ